MFKAILTALVYGYTIIIMLGMGASIDIDVPAEIKKSPKAILCGVASQYMFMPLITWGLICAFDLGDTEALSLMLCGMNMYWLATPHRIAFGDFLISAGTSMSIDAPMPSMMMMV